MGAKTGLRCVRPRAECRSSTVHFESGQVGPGGPQSELLTFTPHLNVGEPPLPPLRSLEALNGELDIDRLVAATSLVGAQQRHHLSPVTFAP